MLDCHSFDKYFLAFLVLTSFLQTVILFSNSGSTIAFHGTIQWKSYLYKVQKKIYIHISILI